MGLEGTKAAVITVSDGVASGHRDDRSGDAIQSLMEAQGAEVSRFVVPDERDEISLSIRNASAEYSIIVTTGGTGFGPRDVTPEATMDVIEREAPGMAQLMIARGLESTPRAALSRLRVGSLSASLVLNLPGSPKGAVESFEAVIDLIPHAVQLLAGDTEH